MNEMNDEAMQEFIDKNLAGPANPGSSVGDKDLNSYSLLFTALKQEPPIPLRHNFAAKVTNKIHAKKTRATILKLYLLLGVVFLVLIAASFLYLSSVDGSPASQFAQALVKYRWVAIFGVSILGVMQFLDKKFVDKAEI